jgi:hypothetical protein
MTDGKEAKQSGKHEQIPVSRLERDQFQGLSNITYFAFANII